MNTYTVHIDGTNIQAVTTAANHCRAARQIIAEHAMLLREDAPAQSGEAPAPHEEAPVLRENVQALHRNASHFSPTRVIVDARTGHGTIAYRLTRAGHLREQSRYLI